MDNISEHESTLEKWLSKKELVFARCNPETKLFIVE
jgi:magnesium-transporting ATPase (P-type)